VPHTPALAYVVSLWITEAALVLGSNLARAFWAQASRIDATADIPCRDGVSAPASRRVLTATRTSSTVDPPRSRLAKARDAFHRQEPLGLVPARGRILDRVISLGLPGFAARSRSSTCFRAGALGPPALGCSPARMCHMPPIDFCNRYDPRTHLRSSQTSICLARTNPPRPSNPPVPASRGGPTGFAQLRGCGSRNTRRKRPLAPTDLPQPDGPGHLLSLTCTS
jgi:hypothetical protein